MDKEANILKHRTRTQLAEAARGSSAAVTYQGHSYQQLSGDMALSAEGKYACCGSAREVILLDMDCPELKALFYDCFKQEADGLALTQTLSAEEQAPEAASKAVTYEFNLKSPTSTLTQIVHYVAKQFPVLDSAAEAEKHIAAQIKKLGADNVLPLALLVKEGVGLCRHQALLVGYLLAQLLHHTRQTSDATIYRFRTNLIKHQAAAAMHQAQLFPHAITIFNIGEDLYLLDSSRRVNVAADGLVLDLNKLDARRRTLLGRCYETYDVSYFMQEIFARYQKPQLQAQP